MIDVGQIAGLPVAEVPADFRSVRGDGFRRKVAELHAHQRHVVVRQRHVAGHLGQKVRRLSADPQSDPPGGQAADQMRVKNLRRNLPRPLRLFLRRIDLPRDGHHGVRSGGGMVILELVLAGRELNVVPAAAGGAASGTVAAGGRGHRLAVDQQKAAIPAGYEESISARLAQMQVTAVAAEKRFPLEAARIGGVEHAFDVVGADRFGGPKRLAHRFETPQVATAKLSCLQQQSIAAGPRRRFVAGRIAAVKNVVGRLTFDRLEGQPAEVARPDLQHTERRRFLVSRGDQHVAAVGANLAVVKELDHDDRIRFSGGNKHRADGVELRAAPAEGLGRQAVDGCKNNRNSCNPYGDDFCDWHLTSNGEKVIANRHH